VQSGKISPEMLAKSLAMQLGFEYVDESSAKIDPLVVTMVPEHTVRRYPVMPIRLEGNTLIVAMKDPRHVFALDDIRLITGKEIQPTVATEESLMRMINRFYRDGADMDELAKAMLEEVGGGRAQVEEDTSAIDDNALVKVVNNIIREAILNDMSDIHIEPRPEHVVVRVRKDGSLREYMTMPRPPRAPSRPASRSWAGSTSPSAGSRRTAASATRTSRPRSTCASRRCRPCTARRP
jgi:type IV pilus assembly protein PilB